MPVPGSTIVNCGTACTTLNVPCTISSPVSVWVTIDIRRLPIAAFPAIVMFTRAVVWLVTWKLLIWMPADLNE
jgi:hypothetical protein